MQTQPQPSRYIQPLPAPRSTDPDDYVEEAPIDSRMWGRINGVWDLAVALAGAVMQGRLFLVGDPQDPMEAVPLQYLEAQSDEIDGGHY